MAVVTGASKKSVVVIGAGVVGLTAALRLLEDGHMVQIWADKFSPNTTSDGAGALIFPYKVDPVDKVIEWTRRSMGIFEDLYADEASGVVSAVGYSLERKGPAVGSQYGYSWVDLVRDVSRIEAADLEAKGIVGCTGAVKFSAPLVIMPTFLSWLTAKITALGGVLHSRKVTSIAEASAAADVVIVCSGLATRSLVNDPNVYPVRGQLVRVDAPLLKEFFLDDDNERGMAYIFPRGDVCVLGGTAIDHGDLAPDPIEADAIVRRCADIIPALLNAPRVNEWIGLRPVRKGGVRLELEQTAHGPVVYNYGHGGAGVTIAWGCAEDVVTLVRNVPAPSA